MDNRETPRWSGDEISFPIASLDLRLSFLALADLVEHDGVRLLAFLFLLRSSLSFPQASLFSFSGFI